MVSIFLMFRFWCDKLYIFVFVHIIEENWLLNVWYSTGYYWRSIVAQVTLDVFTFEHFITHIFERRAMRLKYSANQSAINPLSIVPSTWNTLLNRFLILMFRPSKSLVQTCLVMLHRDFWWSFYIHGLSVIDSFLKVSHRTNSQLKVR